MSYDLVVLSHLRWDFVWQRPQHLMSRWARHRRVFFFEEPLPGDELGLELRETDCGVTVAVPHVPDGLPREEVDAMQQTLLDELFVRSEISDYVLWYYTPMAASFAVHLEPRAIVWDCMDELKSFAEAPAELAQREEALLRRADVVFTGGMSLYRAQAKRHPNVHAFPSSVDAEHYRRARGADVVDPPDQAPIAHPRLGFFGVVDERMDIDLLAGLADARPDWQLVVVGPVVKIDPATLPQRANIHYLGPKSYAQLPDYLAGWDVALMPFALNDATRFISPTKTLEYLAAGKPIVSTPVPDVVDPYADRGVVRAAEDVAGFVDAVEDALAHGVDEEIVESVLAATSWDRTWEAMNAEIERVLQPASRRRNRAARFDYAIVGAGFAGAVVAERLAAQGRRVLVVDRRNHVGGNAYDHYDSAGVLVHRYGPHIFHTNSREVFDYLSRFTEWRPYEHRVRASVDGRLVPLPINLDTINELYGMNLTSSEVESFFESVAEPVERLRTSEDVVVSKVGRELYLKFFRNYTRKQWDLDPSELDASVTARVPTRTNRDDRYFTDTYQAMPKEGYTRMFERMLDHPNISILLQTDWRDIEGVVPYGELVYSGPVDEFFDLRFGKLPYRSLDFQFETHDTEWFQPAPVVNFPNEHAYTRCTEFKWLTGQVHPKTTVVYEHPRAEGDPYYPVPRPENAELYKRYKALADQARGVWFVGRLATYRYYNMDQVVAQALALVRRMTGAAAGAEVAPASEAPTTPARTRRRP